MDKGDKKRTTIYLTPDMLWKLKEVGARRRVRSATLAIEAAVSEWINRDDSASERANAPPPKPHIVPPKRGRG